MLRYHRGISRDATGNFIPLAYVHAYLPGTQTYVNIYADEAGATALQQPIRADAQGIYQFYTREPVIDLRYVLPLVPTGYAYKVPLQIRQTPFVINVDSYGATGDGTTDDRAAVQSAVDAATAIGPGSIVRFTPGRTYAIVGEILGQETLIIDLTGAKIAHKATAYGKGLFRFRPPQQFAVTWPDDIAANSRDWLEQDPPYSQGDYLLFTTDYHWIDRQYKYGNTHYGQAFLVERVHQGTVTLSDFFVQGMKASDGIELRSFKRISPEIRGGEIQTDDSQASGGVEPEPAISYCIRFSHCVYPRIEGTRLNGLAFQYSTYVRFEHCFAPVADGIVLNAVSPPTEDPYGVYGVHFAGATSHGQLLNSDCHGLRHMSDAAWADLVDGEGEVVLLRICGVFWSRVKNCRSFDSVSSGFGPHGCGRYFDFIDCQSFNAGGAGFSTRVSYTRFMNCRAESSGVASYAFDIGGGVQLPTNDQGQPSGDGEGAAFGGQNPLVGCEMVNCTQVGYKKGFFRVCNMSSLTVRDCNMDLPRRLDGENPYYEFFGHFWYSNPRRWQAGWRYLPGDWVRDAWDLTPPPNPSGSYKLYQCKLAHTAETPPHELWPINEYWVEIDGTADRPSPLRGTLIIKNCRFIHRDSGWFYNGMHPDTIFKGPYVFPERIEFDSVLMSPTTSPDHSAVSLDGFRVCLRACRALPPEGVSMPYALSLRMPGKAPHPPMQIDGVVTPGEVRIVDCELAGNAGSWSIDAGATGEYTLGGGNLGPDGVHTLLGGVDIEGSASVAGDLDCAGQLACGPISCNGALQSTADLAAAGDIVAQGRLKAAAGLALGNAQDVPQGFPGPKRKIIMAYDMNGNELGYLVTYWVE